MPSRKTIDKVKVQVLDKTYTVSCPPDEKASLLEAVELLNDKLQEIQLATQIAAQDREQLMVTTAINLAHALRFGTDESDPLSTTLWEEKVDKILGQLSSVLD